MFHHIANSIMSTSFSNSIGNCVKLVIPTPVFCAVATVASDGTQTEPFE